MHSITSKPSVCLNMIVKNESKIIERALESVVGFVDTFCICDTGSTDNTVSLIQSFFKRHDIEGKIIHHEFVSFGHNRTVALKSAVGMADYVLLIDADMVFCNETNDKTWLSDADCFHVWQLAGTSKYKNIRIVRSSLPNLHYCGSTHEHVSFPSCAKVQTMPCELVHIKDVGDGGCKKNKFLRDVRLLKSDLKLDPQNPRALFYLANTYFDLNMEDEAKEFYKKRLERVVWNEEESFALMRLGELSYRKGNEDESVCRWLESFARCTTRLESLYEVVKHYRKKENYILSYLLYKMGEKVDCFRKDEPPLFMDNSVHRFRFFEEGLIIKFYNNDFDVSKEIVQVLNWGDNENVSLGLSNYKFYNPKFENVKVMDFTKDDSMHNGEVKLFSSTPCIIKHPTQKDHYLMNQRFVNYQIDKKNGSYNYKKQVLTRNRLVVFDKDFNELESFMFPQRETEEPYAGVEDVRIHRDHLGKTIFTGVSFHKSKKIGVVVGDYNFDSSELSFREVVPERSFTVEKNWVFTPFKNETHMVYAWHPLQIGSLTDDGVLKITFRREMPGIFRFCRGSTNACKFGNEVWFIVHIVSHEVPRCYYHMFVVFDTEFKTCRYSFPSKFSNCKIEYCIGLIVEDEKIIVSYSTWDSRSYVSVLEKSHVESLLQNTNLS